MTTPEILKDPLPGEGIKGEEAEKSQPWIDMILEAERVMASWQERTENICKVYANLDRMAGTEGDRAFALFWANMQVMRPVIYTRAPVPVVVPRFGDRKPLTRKVAEVLERSLVTLVTDIDMHDTLLSVRDDLALAGRGQIWLRWDDGVHVEHLDRRDFLQEPARKWSEVTWVARRAYMTAKQIKKRFKSVDLTKVDFQDRALGSGDDDSIVSATGPRKADVWEIWHKEENRVIWVSPDIEDVLENRAPHLKVKGFFPCPRPVYSTLQPGSLIPVPDFLAYRDQLDEINDLTARIGALTQALQVKGLYAAGGEGGVGEAVKRAFDSQDDRQILIPVPSLTGLSTQAGGGLIEWLPLEMVSNTIQTLVGLRQQLIQDVYEISGLSDIMRGATNPNETLGAQQLKSQYGSIRVSDRQAEMVRLARDAFRLAAEIMAEEMPGKDILEMGQVDDLPSRADIRKQVKEIETAAKEGLKQAQQAAQQIQMQMQQMDEQGQAMMAQAAEAEQMGQPVDPAQAEAMQAQFMEQRAPLDEQLQGIQQQVEEAAGQMQAQIAQLDEVITVEDVTEFLRDEKTRPFALDIETDSTIAPDEQAEKARKTEFLTAVGGFLQQAMMGIQAMPQMGPLAAEMLRFAAGAFRSSRAMDQAIDDFADQIEEASGQPAAPDPAIAAQEAQAQAEAQKMQAEQAAQQAEIGLKQQEAQREDAKAQAEIALKGAQAKHTEAETQKLAFEIDAEGQKQADKQFNDALKQHETEQKQAADAEFNQVMAMVQQ